MLSVKSLLQCSVIVGFLSACAQEAPTTPASQKATGPVPFAELIPSDARDIRHHAQGNRDQVSFLADRKYPQFVFSEQAISFLTGTGWTRCSSQGDAWTSFVDASGHKPVRLHEKSLHLKKEGSVVLIVGRYVSS